MEEKNIPEQDALPVSPSVSEPEAAEVPVIEALRFASDNSLPEPPAPEEAAPVAESPADVSTPTAGEAPVEAPAEIPVPSAEEVPGVPPAGMLPQEEISPAVDLSILDDPELEEVLFAEETPAPDKDFQEDSTKDFEEMMDAPVAEVPVITFPSVTAAASGTIIAEPICSSQPG